MPLHIDKTAPELQQTTQEHREGSIGATLAGLNPWLERCPVLLHEEGVLVLDKPSGLLCHRGWAQDEVVATDIARYLLGAPAHLIHRLDRGSSGPLSFASSPELARYLCGQFERRSVSKRYLALVRGIAPDALLVDHPIPQNEGGPRVEAQTLIRRLARFERYSLVEARPLSGRFHQVRRHLKHLSLPIIGDANYGKSEHNRLLRERFGLARLALHCFMLELDLPSGRRVCIRSPVPRDLPFEQMGFAPENWRTALETSDAQ